MRKLMLSLVLAAMGVLGLATMANAAPYYHGDFESNSTGCAKCHVTHAASASALLITGTNQTEFCYYCHNSVTKSPYDAMNGKVETPTGKMPSVAGGFAQTFDFDTKTYDATAAALDGNYLASSSVHSVEGAVGNNGGFTDETANLWTNGKTIPGGSSTLVGNFRCGSCHDPHAGGAYIGDGESGTNDVMPRLLKATLPEGTFDPASFDKWGKTNAGEGTFTTLNTWTVSSYGDGISDWCAGCHDVFNKKDHNDGTGMTAESTTSKYMHRIDFVLTDASGMASGQNSIDNIPLTNGGKLSCLTCHRAHGTASTTNDVGTFNRASSYYDSYAKLDASTTNSSVLLRQKDRDVCYNCHKAAAENRPSDQTN